MGFLNLLKFYCLKDTVCYHWKLRCILSVYLFKFKIKKKNYYKIRVQNTNLTNGKNS